MAPAERQAAFAVALVADLEPEHTQVMTPDPYDVEITVEGAEPAKTPAPLPLPALPLSLDAQAFADRLRLVLGEQLGVISQLADVVISETRYLMGKPLPPRSR